jgi:diaminohydroxyphosphoribosylaminopyrimidine deaminase / 5-amino-6-(5-phosphoribosylamino)uracil reductase
MLQQNLTDAHWMRFAAQLATRVTERQVSPNPRVGCVVLNADGQLVGQGWHLRAGTPHAEVNALAVAGDQAKGGTAYVTLEPCNHTGKTPPCTRALIEAGVRRVVVGMTDPNPQVAGQGLLALKQAGIDADGPVEPDTCAALNPVFLHHIQHRLPFTAVKVATTLDGMMADTSGQSQWITGPAARLHVHHQRVRFDALLTTAHTVLADNCQLTVRLPFKTPPPVRVIIDRQGVLADQLHLAIWQVDQAPTWLLTPQHGRVYPTGVQVLPMPDALTDVWPLLYAQGLTSLWVEAGPRFSSALLATPGLVQQLWWYRAGKLLGGGNPAINWHQPLLLDHAQVWRIMDNPQALEADWLTVYAP